MASLPAVSKIEKPSFAKIAAAGVKPPTVQQHSKQTANAQKNDVTSSPRNGATFVTPSHTSNQTAFTPPHKKVAALPHSSAEEKSSADTNGPQVHVQNTRLMLPSNQTARPGDGLLIPTTSDEAGTHISSSSDSAKPPSLDGKSVTSGTTFALDEKESLRPDDSASIMGMEDEESLAPLVGSLPHSQIGSDDEMRAFREQLREITGMEPLAQSLHPQVFAHHNTTAHGVLYIPPQGPGIGNIPGSMGVAPAMDPAVEIPPDAKLLEALDSPKDRIMVLKLEQDIVDFVKDAKESSLKLPQTNAFYRMLAHKLADYYMLGHVVDESTMAVRIYKTPNCRLPPPLTGIATPSTAASTPPPVGTQMKILRRGVDGTGPTIADGSNATSKTTSENGESGNDDDKKAKLPASREEREARYEAARKRIMGSSKPAESPEELVEKDTSRSSSAAGKKTSRRKQRGDSDDDFEARSAYSAYFAAPMTPSGVPPNAYGYPNLVQSHGHQLAQANYGTQTTPSNYPQYSMPSNNTWPHPSSYAQASASNWEHHQPSAYDLSADFQRAMSFQSSPVPTQHPVAQPGINMHYNQRPGALQQAWPQQSPHMSGYTAQMTSGYAQGYGERVSPAPNQFQEAQPYQYGQLPSQTFPGRLPSQLEHPLPGSYKGKHFNPQSQTFVPALASGMNSSPFQSPAHSMSYPAYSGGYGQPTTPQRRSSASSQIAMYSPSQAAAPAGGPARVPSHPMHHPLPQPVFPQQPSPNVPLPSKPTAPPPKSADHASSNPAIVSSGSAGRNGSSIAKWGTPASLPAKPPPSAESFDAAKLVQSQRQPSGPTRVPSGMPSFGSMPSAVNGGGVNGQNV